jgi:hypothetical protein
MRAGGLVFVHPVIKNQKIASFFFVRHHTPFRISTTFRRSRLSNSSTPVHFFRSHQAASAVRLVT